jgi:hypothetical protein
MRSNEVRHYKSVLQTLGASGCPICLFLKNEQTRLLQEGNPEEFVQLCNAHAWAVAAVRQADTAVQIFLSLLKSRSGCGSHECSICLRLEQEEQLRIRELIAAFDLQSVLRWMKKQGVLCLPHGLRLRTEAPPSLQGLIDQILERRAAELRAALTRLNAEAANGTSPHGGVLGRAAEYLAAQRGISLLHVGNPDPQNIHHQ